MPRWLSRLLWMIAQAAAIAVVCCAPAQAGGLYRCAAEDVRMLGLGGKLDAYPEGNVRDGLGSFIVDTDTGNIRYKFVSAQWRVIQKGGPNSDFIASPGLTEATLVTDYIRVRAWKNEPNITYFRVGLTTIFTGQCEAIK